MKPKRFALLLQALLVMLLGLAACGGEATTPPTAPDQSYWPTEGWRTSTPEQQGLDSELLAEAMDFLVKQDDFNIHSLLIIRNGYVVVDAYFHPFPQNSKHDVASVTKSFTSTLVGIAIDKGYIDGVQQPVLDFFPERPVANLDSDKQAMTLEDPLTLRTGLECVAEPTEVTLVEMFASPDWIKFTLDLPMSEEPGTRWAYCSSGVHLLSAIIQQATGMSTLDFAQQHLFKPLGISDVIWPTDPQEINRGWGDLRMTPHDMAKLGLLYLRGGLWDGEQVLPATWAAAATTRPSGVQGPGGGYGYLWWLMDRGYSARGRGGQRVIVLPDENIVMVLTAGGGENGQRVETELLNSYVLPAAQSTAPLSPNPAGVALLQARIQQAGAPAQVEPDPVPPLPDIAQRLSGQTYVMDANPLGLLSASLTFQEPNEALLTFATGDVPGNPTVELLVGLDNIERITPGRFSMPAAAKGSWQTGTNFVIDLNELGNLNNWRMSLTFEDDRVTIVMQDILGYFPTDISISGRVRE